MNVQSHQRMRAVLIVAALATGLFASVVRAQDSPASRKAGKPPRRSVESPASKAAGSSRGDRLLKVFRLKHAKSTATINLLLQLVLPEAPEATITADARTNSLIVLASSKSMNAIERLVEAVDQREDVRNQNPKEEIRFFSLKKVPLDGVFTDVLEMIVLRHALDAQRRLLVVRATERTAAEIEALISELSARIEAPAPEAMKIRVVWLLSGLAEETSIPPTPDLNEVIAELNRIGVSDLRLAAQIVVNVTGEQHKVFQISGTAELETPTMFSVEGVIVNVRGSNVDLQMSITANQLLGLKPNNRKLSKIHTEISVPKGHAVVIGTTPIDKMTSVFVVQVLP